MVVCATVFGAAMSGTWGALANTFEPENVLEPLDGGSVFEANAGEALFLDRDYEIRKWPDFLEGQPFVRSSIDRSGIRVLQDGVIFVITPATGNISEAATLIDAGFERVDTERFTPFSGGIGDGRDRSDVYQKQVQAGDEIVYGRFGVTVWSDELMPANPYEPLGSRSWEPSLQIETVDISQETDRHVIVSEGTEEIYEGHVDTLLMPDNETIFAAWARGHAVHVGPLARSDDGGKTWSDLIDVPDNWWDVSNTPTIHRLVDSEGVERLFVFAGGLRFPGVKMQQAVSEDSGKTWSPMKDNGLIGEVPPKDILSVDDGKKVLMWSDRRDPTNHVWQSASYDGGLTWENERILFKTPGIWAQPAIIRSPDGRQWLMLMREQSRQYNALFSVSDDKGESWSEPRELHPSLTGDRHVIRYAPDGRVVAVMRDRAGQGFDKWQSETYGHFVAWVGTYDDIIERRPGEYRIKLLHSYANWDCGYAGFEVLPDGTFVATTYIKYQPGPKKHSVVSTRFTLDELDKKWREKFGNQK